MKIEKIKLRIDEGEAFNINLTEFRMNEERE
jgi:hypothetical protein